MGRSTLRSVSWRSARHARGAQVGRVVRRPLRPRARRSQKQRSEALNLVARRALAHAALRATARSALARRRTRPRPAPAHLVYDGEERVAADADGQALLPLRHAAALVGPAEQHSATGRTRRGRLVHALQRHLVEARGVEIVRSRMAARGRRGAHARGRPPAEAPRGRAPPSARRTRARQGARLRLQQLAAPHGRGAGAGATSVCFPSARPATRALLRLRELLAPSPRASPRVPSAPAALRRAAPRSAPRRRAKNPPRAPRGFRAARRAAAPRLAPLPPRASPLRATPRRLPHPPLPPPRGPRGRARPRRCRARLRVFTGSLSTPRPFARARAQWHRCPAPSPLLPRGSAGPPQRARVKKKNLPLRAQRARAHACA